MRGRKPTYKNLATKDDGTIVAPVEIPRCPTILKGEARREWWRMTKLLFELGIIALLDRTTLAIYCQAHARWLDAEQHLADEGVIVKSPAGYPVANPYLSVSNGAAKTIKELLSEFGLSPAARARLLGVPKKKQTPDEGGFAGVLACG